MVKPHNNISPKVLCVVLNYDCVAVDRNLTKIVLECQRVVVNVSVV